jgi:hypothetical protein
MVQPTYDDASLLLRLYEIRREAKMRQARHWFLFEFKPGAWGQIRNQFFTGEEQDNHLRMVVSYWDMVCALVKQGGTQQRPFLLHQRRASGGVG